MPKLNLDIYGQDDCGFASDIASDALSNTGGKEENWASSAIDQSAMSRGTSKGTTPSTNPVKADPNVQKGDSRASVKGNHGAQG